MVKKSKTRKQKAVQGATSLGKAGETDKEPTAQHRTFPITQRGIKNSHDLSEFHAAALADIDSGSYDPKAMHLMVSVSRQIIAHENLKFKISSSRQLKTNHFFEGAETGKQLTQ